MKLFLADIDISRWKGLVEIGGDTYKVTLFPGSATEPWRACLEVGGWIELPEGKIIDAIREACEQSSQPRGAQETALLKAINSNPDILNEILNTLKGVTDGVEKG